MHMHKQVHICNIVRTNLSCSFRMLMKRLWVKKRFVLMLLRTIPVVLCCVMCCCVVSCCVCRVVLDCVVLDCIVLCWILLCCVEFCCIVLCCVGLCCVGLCCAGLCCAVLCCSVLCCMLLWATPLINKVHRLIFWFWVLFCLVPFCNVVYLLPVLRLFYVLLRTWMMQPWMKLWVFCDQF